jgi:hypothetical protein
VRERELEKKKKRKKGRVREWGNKNKIRKWERESA